ncbi:MAG: XTP/dITP diphosphatase [Desulfitobacteriaceae bacterium]
MEILLATQNQGKVLELQELLADQDVEVRSLLEVPDWEEVEETGQTFVENAQIKAWAAMRKTGLLTLADDSGLEVGVLDGAPGVFSARFAGEPKDDQKNIDKLLALLENVPDEQRGARFRCALVLVTPDEKEYVVEGTVEGKILRQRKGQSGFGYDPIFFVSEVGQTMAELNSTQKNEISHRAQALRKAVPILQDQRSEIRRL